MSMFHELMMRKKEEIMYATIKGTLTENDGVFSGFSASSYLALQHIIDFSKPFEILLKFTPTDFTTPLYLFSTRYSTNSGLDIYIQNSKIRIWGSTNGTSLDISSYSIDTININTTYWYKLKYSPTQIIAELSTDGINFVQENNIALSNQIYQNNYNALIGHGQTSNTNYFVGSIDLPNSYIKLGSTKYNLQAVVGYTVVGSPTITDGVLTSARSGNYLSITGKEFSNNFELLFKFEIDDTNKTIFFNTRNNSHYFILRVDNNNKIVFFVRDSGSQTILSDNAISLNTIYWVKLNRTGNTITMFISTDGVNYIKQTTTIETTETFTSITSWFGYENFYSSGANFSGKLYVKDCRIWIDNKLWFNGQQA